VRTTLAGEALIGVLKIGNKTRKAYETI
jgi:hypothetical protein